MATENETIISDLTTATSVGDNDYLVIEDAINTKKVTASKFSEYVKGDGYIRVGQRSGTSAGLYSTIEGRENEASGRAGHAEGYGTSATGYYAHSEGYNTVARASSGTTSSHAEGVFTKADAGSHAEGWASEAYPDNSFDIENYTDEGRHVYANGKGAHAEGYASTSGNTIGSVIAYGNGTHAEGYASKAITWGAHAEGSGTLSSGVASHSEGWKTKALESASHTEGYGTIASESYSHAEGCNVTACGLAAHAEGDATMSFDPETQSLDNDEGYWVVASGNGAHAEGKNDYISSVWSSVIASGEGSHAEGCGSQATYEAAHAEGNGTRSSGMGSHSEGDRTNATGYASHAGGLSTIASGDESFAHGRKAQAIGYNSTAFGMSTVADGRNSFATGEDAKTEASNSAAFGEDTYAYGTDQFCIGICNKINGRGKNWIYRTGDRLFQIGNGTPATMNGDEIITPEVRTNVFSVSDSAVYGTGTYNTSGADYAEMFEWADGNRNNEDRVGKFVTLDGSKLVLAKSTDDYILGVVSGNPSVCGDVSDDQWNQVYLTDVYGRPLYEDKFYPELKDEEGNIIREAQTVTRLKVNPDYDSSKEYIPRSDRPEWSPVGLLGKLVCIDDGTAEVNSYVKVNDDSIATASSERTKYRVMERLDKNHIRIMIL